MRSPKRVAILVRADFVAAVLLTVIAPLVLLVRAVRDQPPQVEPLLGYWRSSSLLMVAVYLLIGERRAGFVCGVAARLLIPWTLRRPSDDAWFERWRRLVSRYCLVGAVLTAPLLRCALTGKQSPLCRAYVEPAQAFGDLIHPGVRRATLGRVGEWGLGAFVVGTLMVVVRRLDQIRPL